MAEDERAQYDRLKRELALALPKKRAMDKQLAQLEVQLYNLEGTYLTETAAHSGGNIIQGFENYLKQSLTRRKNEVSENDRVFSNSSLTSQRSLELAGEGEDISSAEDSKQATPSVTTTVITVPPATRNQELSAAHQNKLNRDKEYQRRRRAAQRRDTSDDEAPPPSSASSSRRTKRARLATGDTDD